MSLTEQQIQICEHFGVQATDAASFRSTIFMYLSDLGLDPVQGSACEQLALSIMKSAKRSGSLQRKEDRVYKMMGRVKNLSIVPQATNISSAGTMNRDGELTPWDDWEDTPTPPPKPPTPRAVTPPPPVVTPVPLPAAFRKRAAALTGKAPPPKVDKRKTDSSSSDGDFSVPDPMDFFHHLLSAMTNVTADDRARVGQVPRHLQTGHHHFGRQFIRTQGRMCV